MDTSDCDVNDNYRKKRNCRYTRRDSKDNMFFDCAVATNAYYLVSGDSDLLVIKEFKKVPIVTVNQFFDAHPKYEVT